MRCAVMGAFLAALLTGSAAADSLDEAWQRYLSAVGQERLRGAADQTKLQEFVAQNYGPALQRVAETIEATAGATELRRRDELARAAIAWARPREDALGDLVLSRAYRQGLGVEANLFESLRLLRRPYQAQLPEGLEMLIIALDQGTGLPKNTAGAMAAAARFLPAFRKADQPPVALSFQLLVKPIETLRSFGVPAFLDSKNVGWIGSSSLRSLYGKILIIDRGIAPAFVDFPGFVIDATLLQNSISHVRVDTASIGSEASFLIRTSAAARCMSGLAADETALFAPSNTSRFRQTQIAGFISCSLTGKLPARPPTEGFGLLEAHEEALGDYFDLLAAGAARFGYGRAIDHKAALHHLDRAILKGSGDALPKVLRGHIYDLPGPLQDPDRSRADLTQGGTACLDRFLEYQKDRDAEIARDQLKWQTKIAMNFRFSYKIGWSPLTGVIDGDRRRAMAECAQTALLRAAELGSAEAAYAVTRLPDDAPGITPLTKEKRQALLEQAVDGDVAEAYADLANFYQNRVVVFAMVTSKAGEPPPSRETICSYWQVPEYCLPRPILPLLEKGVERGSPTAQATLGARLLKGSPEEIERGWRLLQQAAETRDPLLLYAFAYQALSPKAPESVRAAGLDALTAAADLNVSYAQFDLARRELARDQTPAEQRRSLMRLYAAAQAGHSTARTTLADAFDKGIGIGAPSAWLGTLWRKGELP